MEQDSDFLTYFGNEPDAQGHRGWNDIEESKGYPVCFAPREMASAKRDTVDDQTSELDADYC
jgi:hypothetical protein